MNKDEIYLNYLANTLNSESQGRLNYLNWLIIINIAIYGVVYNLDGNQLWISGGIKLFAVLALLFVNIVFSIKYLREQRLTNIRDEEFNEYLQTGLVGGDGGVVKYISERIRKKDRCWEGISWVMDKIVFSVFISIPTVYLILLFLNSIFDIKGKCLLIEWHQLGIMEALFAILLLLLSYGLFWRLTSLEYKRINSVAK